MNDQERAQRWHDTDHGRLRGARRRMPYVKWRKEKEPNPAHVSACWCCCMICDPDYDEPRPNPYWSRAQAEFGRKIE